MYVGVLFIPVSLALSVFVGSKLVDLPQCVWSTTPSAEVNSPSPRFQTPVETTPHFEQGLGIPTGSSQLQAAFASQSMRCRDP